MAAVPSPAAPELNLEVEKTPGSITVHCSGKITASSTPLLLDRVRPLIPETKRVVLNLGQVKYLDSSGLGAVVRLWMTSRNANCEFKVTNLSPRIKDLFSITNLSSIFEGVETIGM